MRIAYISYECPPDRSNGGIATYIAEAARMMSRRGHEVEIFASSPSRDGRFEEDGVIKHLIPEADLRDFGIAAGHVFAARHAEKAFDVLEGPEYCADARKAVALVPGIPLVVKMHTPSLMVANFNAPSGFMPYFKNLRHNFRVLVSSILRRRKLQPFLFTLPYLQEARDWDRVEAAHARGADIIAPPCRELCNHARAAWNISEEAIRLSPHPYTPKKDFLSLQPRVEGFTVGFVGRLEKRKGIETLIAAIPSVLNAVPEARFRFIGATLGHPDSGMAYDQWIKIQIPQYAGRLEFPGKYPLERMAEVYGGLDVCVFPSLWENFPNVCLEAMSAARAIVASSAGGMSEMLDDGRAGRLVAAGEASALAHEIISFLKSPLERIHMGELARKRVLEAYNETVIGDLMEKIYHEAIERKTERRLK